AMDGPDWTTAQATRPAHSACRREIRQHGKSGRRSRHLSKAIAEVEHAVGLRLLDCGAHGIEPTIYGRALHAAAPPSRVMNSRRLVCRERSIVRCDRGRVVMVQPPS